MLTESELELDRIRSEKVIAARAAGASWQQIGDALGVTRQSAWESFTAATRAALSANIDANSTLAEDDAVGADGLAAPARALPGAVAALAAALAAGAPTRTSAQGMFTDSMRSGPTILKNIGFARLSPGMATMTCFFRLR